MLSKLMLDWSDSFKKQSILIDVELKEYFRFIRNELLSMKDVYNIIISLLLNMTSINQLFIRQISD